MNDFDGLIFNLSNDDFFERIEGYGFNNGYYSSDLTLVVSNTNYVRKYDISDCQYIQY